MRDYEGLPGYDSWKLATPPEYDDAYFGIEPQEDEEEEDTTRAEAISLAVSLLKEGYVWSEAQQIVVNSYGHIYSEATLDAIMAEADEVTGG